jgi:hypothetical protein
MFQAGTHEGKRGPNLLCKDFFEGSIRDRTTKESRKAAETLSLLSNQRRNPHKSLLDSKV